VTGPGDRIPGDRAGISARPSRHPWKASAQRFHWPYLIGFTRRGSHCP
jgi:hypothetical protein